MKTPKNNAAWCYPSNLQEEEKARLHWLLLEVRSILSPPEQDAWQLHIAGLTCAAIAKRMGKSAGWASTLVCNARYKLAIKHTSLVDLLHEEYTPKERETHCAYCGSVFTVTHPEEFCSRQCRLRASDRDKALMGLFTVGVTQSDA